MFAYSLAKVAYDEKHEIDEVLDQSKTFILNVDQILHQLCNFDGYVTSNTVRPRISLAERQFLSNLKYLPHGQDTVRRNTKFHVELNLDLLNPIEKLIDQTSWVLPDDQIINILASNEGRELPLLRIENQLKVRTSIIFSSKSDFQYLDLKSYFISFFHKLKISFLGKS